VQLFSHSTENDQILQFANSLIRGWQQVASIPAISNKIGLAADRMNNNTYRLFWANRENLLTYSTTSDDGTDWKPSQVVEDSGPVQGGIALAVRLNASIGTVCWPTIEGGSRKIRARTFSLSGQWCYHPDIPGSENTDGFGISAAEFNGLLYVFWRSNGDSSSICYSTIAHTSGSNWSNVVTIPNSNSCGKWLATTTYEGYLVTICVSDNQVHYYTMGIDEIWRSNIIPKSNAPGLSPVAICGGRSERVTGISAFWGDNQNTITWDIGH
jgi:hypothetical protein